MFIGFDGRIEAGAGAHGRQRRRILIGRIGLLALEDHGDLFPCGIEAARTWGHIGLDEAMQPGKMVTGDGGVHVVLGVIVHVPIEELDDGVEVDGAAAQAKIKDRRAIRHRTGRG